MNYLTKTETLLKSNLKGKRTVNLAIVVSFLISGAICFDAQAADLRSRNNISPLRDSASMTLSENGSDVINIVNPTLGISHNKYESFNVEKNENVIFNNSMQSGKSLLGGNVLANEKLKENADVILNEIKGNMSSYINGNVEVFGKSADLVIANENGIAVNGAKFYNASSLVLGNAKVSVEGEKYTLSTLSNDKKLTVGMEGLLTDSKYLSLIAKDIEIEGKINSEDSKNTDINLIAGENKISVEKSKSEILEQKLDGGYVNMGELGSMYAKNISIISKDANLSSLVANEDVNVLAKDSIDSKNIEGRNIKLKAEKEITNRATLKASENVSLDSKVVKNESVLVGKAEILD